MTLQQFVARDGYAGRSIYLSLIARASISRHNGAPVMEAYNPVYGYWATARDLSAREVTKYLGAGYLRNMR